jgi:hypothetical protein
MVPSPPLETVPEKSIGSVLILKAGLTHGSPGRRGKSTASPPFIVFAGSTSPAMTETCYWWRR